MENGAKQGDQLIKNGPIFQKVGKNSCQAKKGQNIYIYLSSF
jgi:hypothetical protein